MSRALAKYMRQTGTTFSQRYMEETLGNHARIVRKLVELFRARFDPRRRRRGARPRPSRWAGSSRRRSTRCRAWTRIASCEASSG